jgi:NADH dehydrogenase
MQNAHAVPHVVIVGGGFAGIAAARALMHTRVRITLLDRTNHNLFQPLLFQVTAGIVEAGTISAPIRSLFRHQRNVDVRMAEVDGIDKDRQLVYLTGESPPIHFDYLILATGVRVSYFGHDEWAQFAHGMKTLLDADRLRRQIVGCLELADQEPDPRAREELMRFVLVGAGPSGCELAGSLAGIFRRGLPQEYRHIDPRQAHIVLLEAGPRALTAFSEPLARGAVNQLRSLGVDVRLGKPVELIDEDGVVVGGERLRARTVVWTAGVAASPAGQWLGTETDRMGRVLVGTDLSVPGYPRIFAAGDTAHIEYQGKPLPCVATVALQSGEHIGRTLAAHLTGAPGPGPFAFFDKGNMATISLGYAIAETGRIRLSGVIGKLAWAFIHVQYLGQAEGQALLCMQWLINLLLSRTSARYIDEHVPLIAAERTPAGTR